MTKRWISIFALVLVGTVSLPASLPGVTPEAAAAPAPYRVGHRLKAKRDCTVKGFAIKKGVVLTVAAVHEEGKRVDLEFSGMTIPGVTQSKLASLFQKI